MPVDKFSISLPEELVADVDELAQLDGLTRSAIIREATTDYVSKRKHATYESERRARVDAAIEGFRRISDDWGPDERTTTELLREIRGESESEDD